MEPFQDDILSRRLDDLTHQLRMLTLSFSTFQQVGSRHPDSQIQITVRTAQAPHH